MSEVAEVEQDEQPPVPSRGARRRRPAGEKKKARKSFPKKVENAVWARAAGRCQYQGCNKLLIGDQISGAANANTSYIAHIVADSPDGPRGDEVRSPLLAHDPDNLMLVCDVHHRVFDRDMLAEHPEEVLVAMKRRHEARIRTVTGIDEDLGSHVIRYAAKIGANESPVAKGDLKWSMIPERYPLDDGWIDLDLITLDLRDDHPDYWPTHVRNLRSVFGEKVRGRMERQEIRRLTVFGLAPIPLLFELGRLISDIATADVRQLLRDPKGWKWDPAASPVEYDLRRPDRTDGKVALKLEISAPVVDERVRSVLGPDASIWSISASGAHNDIVRRPEDLAAFAKLFRKTLDDIKLVHGEDTTVNVFPAVPVSIAVEAGRSWQPKAHPRLAIYDQNWKLGGFKVRTPLQRAIMILKRHRDITFIDRFDERPISVILTTLAAHAYDGEPKIADALFAVLSQMDRFIVYQTDGTLLIANPSDPSENFADKWKKHPERQAAFFEWLQRARDDFARAAALSNTQLITDNLAKGSPRAIHLTGLISKPARNG